MVSRESILLEAGERAKKIVNTVSDPGLGMNTSDWVCQIAGLIGSAVNAGDDLELVRTAFIHTASVCLAAVECMDKERESWRALVPIAQEMANEHGEIILIIPLGAPKMEGPGSPNPYCTGATQASSWEKEHAVMIVEPTL